MKRLWFLVVVLALAVPLVAGDKKKEQYSELKITVVKATNGKPLRNASVVLHPVDSKGKQESGGLNLKTNADGETSYSGVPYGKLRVQVIMQGWQTYGGDHDINQPEQEIVIKMEPPQKQYSIYEHGLADAPGIDPDKPQQKPAQKPEEKKN